MLLKPLPKILFFGGKGGVGKTTLAAATAAGFAQQGEKVLLISTDPAHSIGDLLDRELGDEPQELTPGLHVRELDPDRARIAYLATVKENIRRFAAPEFLREAERQVELSGQHPGVAESALFEALCRQLDSADNWDRIIIDTAPSGHTLHLLTLPESMAAWTEALLTRQSHLPASTAPEGEVRWRRARDILEARRALFERTRNRLRDAHTSGFILVVNDDRLSVREGERVRTTLEQAGVFIPAVIVNKIADGEHQVQARLQDHFPRIPILSIAASMPAPQGLEGLAPVIQTMQMNGVVTQRGRKS